MQRVTTLALGITWLGIGVTAQADNQCPPGMSAVAGTYGANCSTNYTCWVQKSAYVDSGAGFGFLDRYGAVKRVHMEYGESAVNPSASGGYPTWYYQCGLQNPDGSRNDSQFIASHECPIGSIPYKGVSGACAGQGLAHMCWRPKANGTMVFQYVTSTTPGAPLKQALLADGAQFGSPAWYVQCGISSDETPNRPAVVPVVLEPATDTSSCLAMAKANMALPAGCALVPPQPAISLLASSAVTGSTIQVTVKDPGASATDWVGVFPVGAALVSANMVGWQYLNGSVVAPSAGVPSASLTFPVPPKVGSFVFVLFNTNSYNVIVQSSALTVTAPVITATATSTVTATQTSSSTATYTVIGTYTLTGTATDGRSSGSGTLTSTVTSTGTGTSVDSCPSCTTGGSSTGTTTATMTGTAYSTATNGAAH